MRRNKLNLFVCSLLLLLSPLAFGQDFDYQRDFGNILTQSRQRNSPLFYPSLLERFQLGDSSLSQHEVLALLIGYTGQVHYLPYQSLGDEALILQLMEEKKYEEALSACNRLLKHHPLSLTALMERARIYQLQARDSLSFHQNSYLKIANAVEASGDGSFEKPFFVLSPLDGQMLIEKQWEGSCGARMAARDKWGHVLEVLEFRKAGEQARMLHFNISHATAKMFSSERKAAMEDLFEDTDVLSKKKKVKNQ